MTDEECEEDKDLGYQRPNLVSSFRHQIYDLKSLKIDKESVLKKKMYPDETEFIYSQQRGFILKKYKSLKHQQKFFKSVA